MRSDIFHVNPHIDPDGTIPSSLFDENGEICGSSSEITPELLMKLGFATAKTATRIAVGYSECTLCKLLANAFITGAASSGAQVTEVDASIFAVASYIARSYLFNLTVFIENDKSSFRIRMADRFGLPIGKTTRRQIEGCIRSKKVFRAALSDIVMPKNITGSREVFESSVAKRETDSTFPVSVSGKGIASQILRNILTLSGYDLAPEHSERISLSVSDDGTSLRICDEGGHWYDDGHVDAILAFVFFSSGARSLAVRADAPGILEQIADSFGGKILRIGRDSGANECFLSQNVLCDAFSSAVTLCNFLSENDISVREIVGKLPDFTLISKEVNLAGNISRILSKIANAEDGLFKESIASLRVCTDGGWVNIRPSRMRGALHITGEGANEEIASELCNLFVERARELDNES
ncbi:MAG: hypothetical protein IKU65_06575 [Oscillospiraceae bacterium]|nr:hypothetical protein [Oscillospiraceae bacterium]